MRIFPIRSLLLLLSQFISTNVCGIFYLDLFYAGSTHLHGIRAGGLLRKSTPNYFLQVLKIEKHRKDGLFARNTSHAS
jgi:hypothetical protein